MASPWKGSLLRFLPVDLKRLLYMFMLGNDPRYAWVRRPRDVYQQDPDMQAHFDFYAWDGSNEEMMRFQLIKGSMRDPGCEFTSVLVEGNFGLATGRVTFYKVATSHYVPLRAHEREYRRNKLVYESSWNGEERKLKVKWVRQEDMRGPRSLQSLRRDRSGTE